MGRKQEPLVSREDALVKVVAEAKRARELAPRPGAVRHKNEAGEWVPCNPGDPLFSTATMLAAEFWDGDAWKPIFEDDE